MNTFPYDRWEDVGPNAYFTFGEGGAWALVALMIVVTLLAFIGWIRVEGRKLDEQAARLRGGVTTPPGSTPPPEGTRPEATRPGATRPEGTRPEGTRPEGTREV
jgi:hypothetical protein